MSRRPWQRGSIKSRTDSFHKRYDNDMAAVAEVMDAIDFKRTLTNKRGLAYDVRGSELLGFITRSLDVDHGPAVGGAMERIWHFSGAQGDNGNRPTTKSFVKSIGKEWSEAFSAALENTAAIIEPQKAQRVKQTLQRLVTEWQRDDYLNLARLLSDVMSLREKEALKPKAPKTAFRKTDSAKAVVINKPSNLAKLLTQVDEEKRER